MFEHWKSLKGVRGWYVWKLKLIDARLYFVSIFVGLLTGLIAVPYHYLLQFFFDIRRTFFDAHPRWYWHIMLFLALWGILIFVSWLVRKMPLITGGGIPQTRGVINGRISYKHPFIEMVSKFAGGVLALTAGLSLGREGPSVQIGSYVGCLVSKWTRVLAGERKQLLAAGAGAGLAAAFSAPLASSLLVIESIERFDAPKTAITTLLAGVVAGGVASWIFPISPYRLIDAIEPLLPFLSQVKLFLLLAVVISLFGKFYSELTLYFKQVYSQVKHPVYMKMLYLLVIAYAISLLQVNLTGGGEQFLLEQVTDGSRQVMWVLAMMMVHFVFTALSISSGLPGGNFIPTLVTGGLFGQIVALILVQRGFIAQENVSYIMLISMSAFLVAVIRTPLTAIVLITEITGHFEVFYPSVVVGGTMGPAFLPGVISGNGRYPVGCEDFCNLHGAFPRNTEVKDTPHHLCRFFVHNPFLFILRVFYVSIRRVAGDVLPGFAPHLYHCPDFLAGILGVVVVEYIFEHRKIIFPFGAVHIIVDGNKADVIGRKDEILKPPHVGILPSQPG